jgi:hypothetical protein
MACAAMAAIGLASSAHAGTISNFNQNPQGPGFNMTGTTFTPTVNVPIDYTFLTPPGNGGAYGTASVAALLTITSGGLVAGTGSSLGGGIFLQSVNFNFQIVTAGVAQPGGAPVSTLGAGTNLLTGNLFGNLLVNNNNASAVFTLNGATWTSATSPTAVLYQGTPTSPPVVAQLLGGYTSSWALNNISPTVSLVGGNITPFGGTSLTGSFSAVPEPASVLLMGLGLAGVPGVLIARKRLARA